LSNVGKRDELRLLTPRARRVAVWIATAGLAACAIARDVVTTIDVGSVSITPPATTVSVGSQIPLQALVQDPSGKTITATDVHWSVENPSIATISNTGVVTGVALGSTQVAASVNGKSGIATITVEKTPVASVAVTPPHVDAAPGGQAQLSATAYDAAQNPLGGRAITWSTSSAAVATVDPNGMMTAVTTGSATITATSEGKNGTATISVSQAAVATVTVTPSPITMTVGQTTQFTATLKDAAGSALNGRVVTWGSSNPAAAGVSTAGLVTAVASGSTTITASSEGKSGTASVTISNVAVGSVAVQPQGPSIVQGTNVQLSAIVRDVNGNIVTDRVVTWSSSSTTQAVVSSTGIVTGVSPGTVIITATSEGKSGTTAVNVTQVPVASVTLSPASVSVRTSKTATLTATVKDSLGNIVTNRPITWSSSNNAIATVNAGLVTGVAVGTATITATSEGKSGTATVNVTAIPVASVVVSPATKSMLVTQTFPLTVTVTDSAGTVVTDRVVTWASGNTAAATVSALGVVTAVGPGTATITATSEGKSGSSTITVTPVPVGIVVVQPPKDSIALGTTAQLTAITEDSVGHVLTGRTVTWGSSNTTVATVDGTGFVAAKALGTATITASSEGKSGTSAITVYVPVASVTVAPPTATVLVTQTKQFTATTKDAQGNTLTGRLVTWGSSNTDVATVDATGLATAKALGTATITATSEGKSGTATLTVNPVPVFSVSITPPSPDTVFLGYTTQLTATTKDSIGGILTGRVVTWQSNNTGIATVNASGLVSAVTAGSTFITATSEGKNSSNTMVSMKPPVATVTVSPSFDSVTTAGSTSTRVLTATVTDVKGTVVTDRVVSWTSAPGSVATVAPSSGASTTVTGKGVGSATVVATSETKADTSTIKVILSVTSVQIAPPTATLSLTGTKTIQLTATAKNGGTTITGRTITWSSNAPAVASVNATTGLVTAVGLGTAQITAHIVLDGVNSSLPATITVTP
jgi:trimeric autotransporter adhesin